jgi:hypothetical protein
MHVSHWQVKRSISTWLHKFAITAEKAVVAEFEIQGLNTVAERAEFVKNLLGDVDDVSSNRRPFLWKSAYENLGAGDKNDRPQVGVFVTPLQPLN